jgi:hypothetical protein
MRRSTSPPEVDRRSVVLATLITVGICLANWWPDEGMSKLQTEFTFGGLAMVVCWALLAVVAEPGRRAKVRGVAGGVVLGLMSMTVLAVAVTSVWVLLMPFTES